jgi:hypothetical protein
MNCERHLQLIFPGKTGSLKRAGAVRSGVVGCLTELGIVCFPAVSQAWHRMIAEPQGREALRGPRRSSGSPGPDRAGSRSPTQGKRSRANPTNFFASEHYPARPHLNISQGRLYVQTHRHLL